MITEYTILYRITHRRYISFTDYDQVKIRATTEASALEKFKSLCKSLRLRINDTEMQIISPLNNTEHANSSAGA